MQHRCYESAITEAKPRISHPGPYLSLHYFLPEKLFCDLAFVISNCVSNIIDIIVKKISSSFCDFSYFHIIFYLLLPEPEPGIYAAKK